LDVGSSVVCQMYGAVEQSCCKELPVETSVEQCPLCGTELSRVKFREIQSKLREEEQRRASERAQFEAAIRQRLEQQFEKQKEAAEKKARDEAAEKIKNIAAERDQAAKKLKEAQEREAEIRKHAQQQVEKERLAAEEKAKKEAAQQVKKAVAERDELAKKLKDAQERELEIRKQAQQEAEKQRLKELAEQRHALEQDKKLAILKEQSASARERETLVKKVQRLESQLAKKTANDLGDGAEIDLFESLREQFPGDNIKRIPKGQAGADILHEVLYKGEPCGRIIIDSKNRQSWQNGYVTKLRQDQVEAGAEHAILATTVFPAGRKELCIESGVIVMAPARVIYVAQLLRQAMVTMHVKGLSMKERASKMSRLYSLITSESYAGKLSETNKITKDILELDVQEKTTHDNVWKKRGALVKRMQNVLREIETDVAAVIEGGDVEGVPVIGAKGVGGDGIGSAAKEAVGWNKQ